jgi:DnaJ-class molecular chaperone
MGIKMALMIQDALLDAASKRIQEQNDKMKQVIEAAYELRHVKFGREYKKACHKFDKLYEELNNTDRLCKECKGRGLPTRKHSDLADKCEDCGGSGYEKENK